MNSITAMYGAAPHLKRVVLVTGTKYYGVHLGPLKTPMRETIRATCRPIITSIRLTGSLLTSEERSGTG